MTSTTLVLAVPASLGAAGSFAVANVTQMRATRNHATKRAFDPGLLVRLASEPLWLAGLAASIVGFALEATALAVAPIVLVQPLIVAELLFALPLAATFAGSRLGRREWTGAGLVAFGLVFFLLIIRPSDSPASTSWNSWLIIGCAIAAISVALLFTAEHCTGMRRTSAFAAAAGISLGMLSVLTKATMEEFGARGFGAFATLAPWSVAFVGLIGLLLQQSAYRSGPLAVSLPLIDVGEPLVASAIAVMAFGEQLGRLDVAMSTGLAVAGAVVAGGVAMLDHSPLVQAAQAGLSLQTDTAGTMAPTERQPGEGVSASQARQSALPRDATTSPLDAVVTAPARRGLNVRAGAHPWRERALRSADIRAVPSDRDTKRATNR